ncbi:hypothetical protein EDC04DRAFT_2966643 [Pisolithus marmoratus]|nr:hypothetical protein EDC04DRAFT_2966643 [Pisolithus marmoratus]
MIDLDDGAEESCEEQEFMVMNEDPYEPQGGEVEEYWPSDRKESPKNGSEITFINLNPSLFSTSDSHTDGPRQFTVYVQVWTTSPDSHKPGGKSAKVSATKIISRGPFKCDMAATFPSFKSHAAKALSCQVSALSVSKFKWKFENQAQGAPQKKVADETGYEALLNAVKAKCQHKNVVIWLYTLVLRKDEEDSDMGEMDNAQPIDLDCEFCTDFNSKASLDGMVSQVKAAQAQLEQTYPLSGCPLFPDRHVWHNKTNDTYFRLMQIRIKYWAVNIVSGKCDTSAPLVLAHFADSNKLKVPMHPPHVPT